MRRTLSCQCTLFWHKPFRTFCFPVECPTVRVTPGRQMAGLVPRRRPERSVEDGFGRPLDTPSSSLKEPLGGVRKGEFTKPFRPTLNPCPDTSHTPTTPEMTSSGPTLTASSSKITTDGNRSYQWRQRRDKK